MRYLAIDADDRIVFICDKHSMQKIIDLLRIDYLRNLMTDTRVICYWNDQQRDKILAACKKIGLPVFHYENMVISGEEMAI